MLAAAGPDSSAQPATFVANQDFEGDLTPSVEEGTAGKLVEGLTDESPASGRFAYRVWGIESTPCRQHSWRLRPTFVAPAGPVDVSFSIRKNRITNPGSHFDEHGGPVPVEIALYDETDQADVLTLLRTSTQFLTGNWRTFGVRGLTLNSGHAYAFRCRVLWLGGDALFDLDDIRVTQAALERPAGAEDKVALRSVDFLDPFLLQAGLCRVKVSNGLSCARPAQLTLAVSGNGIAPSMATRGVILSPNAVSSIYVNLAPKTSEFYRTIQVHAKLMEAGQTLGEARTESALTPAFFSETVIDQLPELPSRRKISYETHIRGDLQTSQANLVLRQELLDVHARVLADLGSVDVPSVPFDRQGSWKANPGMAGPCALVSRLYYQDMLLDKWSTPVQFPGEAPPLAARTPEKPFPFRVSLAWQADMKSPQDVALVDLNGDGVMDVVITQHWANQVTALDGRDRHLLWTFKTHSRPDRIKLADVDGDGFAELLISDFQRSPSRVGTLYVLRRNGELLWEAPVHGPGHGVATADLHNDGRPELLAGTCSAQIHCFAGDGAPLWLRWVSPHRWSSVDVLDAAALAARERPSIVGESWQAGNVTLFCLDHAGELKWSKLLGRNTNGPNASAIAMADLDGDGKREIVAAVTHLEGDTDTRDEDCLWVLNGDGTVMWSRGLPELPGCSRAGVKVLDVDGDGKPEILSLVRRVGNPGHYFLDVLRHDGTLLLCHEFTVEGTSAAYDVNGWQIDAAKMPDGSVEVVFGASSEAKLVGLRMEKTGR